MKLTIGIVVGFIFGFTPGFLAGHGQRIIGLEKEWSKHGIMTLNVAHAEEFELNIKPATDYLPLELHYPNADLPRKAKK